MINNQNVSQPTLFEPNVADTKEFLLYALGDFQARGKILANRELALDRLRGAFKRAAEKFQTAEMSDEAIVEMLERLGAKVVKVPNFVAKHPFRVTVQNELAERAAMVFKEMSKDD